jgi:penicillin-binding protein 1A
MDRVLHFAPVAGLRRLLEAAFRGRPWLTASCLLGVALVLWSVAVAIAWFTWDLTMNLPNRQALRSMGDMAQSTTLFDRHDQPVFTIFREQRIEVPLGEVSPLLVKAVVAIEDQRFYDHRGVDVVRVLGAVVANLRSGRRSQGGSTITQQLARLSFLTRDKTFRRKLKEMLLATQIEHAFEKDEILELYLNKVYLGDGFHGVEAASRGYFARPAKDLDVAQAALLAGLIQSPSGYAPTENKARAIARRGIVLQAMLDSGAIDRETFDRARSADVVLTNGLQKDEASGLYFKEAVRRELVDRFGWERVSEGGLRVYTTIDTRLQAQAEHAVEESLEDIERRKAYPHAPRAAVAVVPDEAPPYLQAAAVSIEPATGEVLAMVGGRDFRESRFNRATQAKRQPGSAFKPVLYAAAIEGGMSPATLLDGLDDHVLVPGGTWMPEDEHSGSGAMTLRSALRTSSNRAAARLIRHVGVANTLALVEKLHLGPMPAVPSIALGAGEVTLSALTASFAAFATGGVVRRPVLIRRVEDDAGNVLFRDEATPETAMSDMTAFIVASMLQDVINYGTAARARGLGFSLPAGGKTGTTNDYMDAWFVGFTPSVVTGVWVGFDQPRTIMPRAYAGDVAVPMWTAIMKAATEGAKPEWVPRPEGLVSVQVCRVTGKLASEGCEHVVVTDDEGLAAVKSMVYYEYFPRGKEPSEFCDAHPYAMFTDQLAGAAATSETMAPGVLGVGAADQVPGPPLREADERTTARGDEKRQEQASGEAGAPQKKRGFWSRLFGRGKDKDADKDNEGEKPRGGAPPKPGPPRQPPPSKPAGDDPPDRP